MLHFANTAYDTAHLLDTGVLMLSFALLFQRRLFGVIRTYAYQALVLAAAAALDKWRGFFNEGRGEDVFLHEVWRDSDDKLAPFSKFNAEGDDARFEFLEQLVDKGVEVFCLHLHFLRDEVNVTDLFLLGKAMSEEMFEFLFAVRFELCSQRFILFE